MGGPLSLRAEILGRPDQALPKIHLPETVDGDPRREGVGRVHQPAGEFQPIRRRAVPESREQGGDAGLDPLRRAVVGSPVQDEGLPGSRSLLHHHDGGKALDQALPLGRQFQDPPPAVLDFHRRVLIHKAEAQLFSLSRGPLGLWDPGDPVQALAGGEDGDALRGNDAAVDADVVDLTSKPLLGTGRADPQRILDVEVLVHEVQQDPDRRRLAVDVDPDALGLERGVVGRGHVAPLAGLQRLDRLDPERVVQPAHDQIQLELPVSQKEAVPARALTLSLELTLGLGENGPLGSLGPDPCRQREAVGDFECGDRAGVHVSLVVEAGRRSDGTRNEVRHSVQEPGLGRMHTRSVGRQVPVQGVGDFQVVAQGPVDQVRVRERLFPRSLEPVQFGSVLFEFPFRPGQLRLQLLQPALLSVRRRRDEGGRVPVLERSSLLRDVVEVGEHLVELALGEGVVLVIVTAGAAHGQAQPDRGGGLDPIHHVFHPVFLGNDPAFPVSAVVAIEGAGDPLIQRGVRQHVACDLLDGEVVEGEVPVEGVDHPVAPAPHAALGVGLVAVGVGIAGGVQPTNGHALPVAGRVEQPVDGPLIRFVGRVLQKAVHDLRLGRKAGQVQRGPADERGRIGLGRRLQPGPFQTGQNESVNGIPDPLRIADGRRFRPYGGTERPVVLPVGALIDPAPEELLLMIREALPRVARRHSGQAVPRVHPVDEAAPLRVSRNDGEAAAQIGQSAIRRVQAQGTHALVFVRPVTGEALVRQDRPNVPVELDGRVRTPRARALRPCSRSDRQDYDERKCRSGKHHHLMCPR